MAMTTSGPSGARAEINITSLIDVLLVLLILFMVIHPALQKGIDVQVPAHEESTAEQAPDQIVLHVAKGPIYSINGEIVTTATLEQRIRDIFAARPRRVLFVRGDDAVPYQEVVAAIDAARGASIDIIGLVPRDKPVTHANAQSPVP
jgi:biopolymer transport protein ExbD